MSEPLNEPVLFNEIDAVDDAKVASIPSTKSSIFATPNVVPSSLISCPVPSATTPVNNDPSPVKVLAVTAPATLKLSAYDEVLETSANEDDIEISELVAYDAEIAVVALSTYLDAGCTCETTVRSVLTT